MKFKIGDRVRVTKDIGLRTWLKPYTEKEYLVLQVFKCANPDKGCYNIGEDHIIPEEYLEMVKPGFNVGDKVRFVGTTYRFKESIIGKECTIRYVRPETKNRVKYGIGEFYCAHLDELELVEAYKPKFNIEDYRGDYVMHVTTKDQAKIFCEYMHGLGKTWAYGQSYADITYFGIQGTPNGMTYLFNEGLWGTVNDTKKDNYTILEFEDFDWSDFMSRKEFTKKDLRNGDVIKRRNGDVEIVCLDTETCIRKCGFNPLSDIRYDLTDNHSSDRWDIVEVRRPVLPSECCFGAFDGELGELVYERYPKVEEMTLEEVCKALGKEIKIVKEK